MNNIIEPISALYSLVFDYAFVDAHDPKPATWCRRIWINALWPDRIMKQENHLWTIVLAPDATHHAHDPVRTTRCKWLLIASFTGASLQNMVRATVFLWISAVWLIAHHVMHISSSAWCCMRTSSTFLWLGAQHIYFDSCAKHNDDLLLSIHDFKKSCGLSSNGQ